MPSTGLPITWPLSSTDSPINTFILCFSPQLKESIHFSPATDTFSDANESTLVGIGNSGRLV